VEACSAYKLLINDRAKYAAFLLGISIAVFLMIPTRLRGSGRSATSHLQMSAGPGI